MKENRLKNMHPGFVLNCHIREQNPLFEAHDPSMMYDPVSGFCYSYATDSAITSKYRQGIPVRRSKDLIDFEFVGYALSEQAIAQGRDNGEYPPTPGFWAPYAEYVQGEYRLYYSATKAFGSSESRIWLAVSERPEGPFENRGVVMDTWGTDDTFPNAIDPHIVDDEEGRKYLVYGSFFGGIFLKELDAKTGLAVSGDAFETGICIAHKPEEAYLDGPEGAAILFHAENRYYYLFLSYGWLGDSYDIRVGRSKSVSGPYVDMDGKNLNHESLGQKLAGSYFFEACKPYAKKTGAPWTFAGFRGPGHGVPFYHKNMNRYFFVHHVRDGAPEYMYRQTGPVEQNTYRMHYLVVRSMEFVNDWPVFYPEPYAGELQAEQTICFEVKDGVPVRDDGTALWQGDGEWEWIALSNDTNDIARSQKKGFHAKGCVGVLGSAFDFENSRECVIIAAYDKKHRSIWGKYAE